MLDDELTARLAIQTRAFSFYHSSLSSEGGSTSNSTYERIFPLCTDYQEPSRFIRKLPEFSQSTECLGKLSQFEKQASLRSTRATRPIVILSFLLKNRVRPAEPAAQTALPIMQRQISSVCRSLQTAAPTPSQLST